MQPPGCTLMRSLTKLIIIAVLLFLVFLAPTLIKEGYVSEENVFTISLSLLFMCGVLDFIVSKVFISFVVYVRQSAKKYGKALMLFLLDFIG